MSSPHPPWGYTLQCQGGAGGTRWAGLRRKEHSFPCADGPRRAPAAPGSAPAPPSSSAVQSWQGVAQRLARWSLGCGPG